MSTHRPTHTEAEAARLEALARAKAVLDGALPDAAERLDLETPEAEAAHLKKEIAVCYAKEARLHRSNAPGSSREASELGRHIGTLRKRLKEVQAEMPDGATDSDPAAQRAAILAFVRGLPQDDPFREDLRAALG